VTGSASAIGRRFTPQTLFLVSCEAGGCIREFPMANEALKKVAVLTGLTMAMGGAEVSGAATMTTEGPFSINLTTPGPPFFAMTATQNVPFTAFNTSLGTLDSALFTLNTTSIDSGSGAVGVLGLTENVTSTGQLQFGGSLPLTDFNTAFTAIVTLTNNSENNAATWDGNLSLTYDYTPATPLPASLPLLATGLGGLGLAAWRSRRKQKPATES
jgi:hypothetical protein